MKKPMTLEEKIKRSGQAYIEQRTAHLKFTRSLPTRKFLPLWLKWSVPLSGLATSVVVLTAILIGSTQPQNSFEQLFLGIQAKNQVSFPNYDQRLQSEDYLEGHPEYRSLTEDVLQFFQETGQTILSGNDNVVYSPLSAYSALALLLEAADGSTYQALADLLNVDQLETLRQAYAQAFIDTYLEIPLSSQANAPIVARSQQANGVFVREGISIEQQYLTRLANDYFTEVFTTAFDDQGKEDIARWLNQRTFDFLNMKPEDLSFTPNTVMTLFNTLYLKANWLKAYAPSDHTLAEFTHSGTGIPQTGVTFMHKDTLNTVYVDQPHFTLGIDEAYGDHRVVYVLPKANLQPIDLLQPSYFSELVSALQQSNKSTAIRLSIPEHTMQMKMDLKTNLLAVAPDLDILFDPDQADLSKALPGTYLENIIQHTRLDFQASGFEAAAITEANVGVTSTPVAPSVNLMLNRSFLFFILNGQGLLLFAGVVHQPQSN